MRKTEIMNISNGIHFCFGNTILFDLKDFTSKINKETLKKVCLDVRELKQHILKCIIIQNMNDKNAVLSEITKIPFESLKAPDIYKLSEQFFDYIRKYGIVKFHAYAYQTAISIGYECVYVYKTYFTIETPLGPVRINLPRNENNELILDYIRNLSSTIISYEKQQLMITLKRRSSSMFKPKQINEDQEE